MNFGTIVGILTLLFTFIAIGSAILLRWKNKFKITIKIIQIILGTFGLIYFIIFRYTQDVINLINMQGSGEDISIYYSKVLLLDMCPFMYVLLNLTFIFDFKNKIIKFISLWSIIGSSITIIGSIWEANDNGDPIKYIFIGSSEGALYYFIHGYMLIFGTFFFVYNNRLRFIDVSLAHIFAATYLIYVLIIVKSLNITQNATGIVKYDWVNVNGEYHQVYQMFNLGYPAIKFLSYFLVWCEMIVLIILRNSFAKPTLQWFWPKWVYKKIKFWNNISLKWYHYRLSTI